MSNGLWERKVMGDRLRVMGHGLWVMGYGLCRAPFYRWGAAHSSAASITADRFRGQRIVIPDCLYRKDRRRGASALRLLGAMGIMGGGGYQG